MSYFGFHFFAFTTSTEKRDVMAVKHLLKNRSLNHTKIKIKSRNQFEWHNEFQHDRKVIEQKQYAYLKAWQHSHVCARVEKREKAFLCDNQSIYKAFVSFGISEVWQHVASAYWQTIYAFIDWIEDICYCCFLHMKMKWVCRICMYTNLVSLNRYTILQV